MPRVPAVVAPARAATPLGEDSPLRPQSASAFVPNSHLHDALGLARAASGLGPLGGPAAAAAAARRPASAPAERAARYEAAAAEARAEVHAAAEGARRAASAASARALVDRRLAASSVPRERDVAAMGLLVRFGCVM